MTNESSLTKQTDVMEKVDKNDQIYKREKVLILALRLNKKDIPDKRMSMI
ncbi:hypothetical protein [Peribacillus simplex]